MKTQRRTASAVRLCAQWAAWFRKCSYGKHQKACLSFWVPAARGGLHLFDFICSGEMNSPGIKILVFSQNARTAQTRRPALRAPAVSWIFFVNTGQIPKPFPLRASGFFALSAVHAAAGVPFFNSGTLPNDRKTAGFSHGAPVANAEQPEISALWFHPDRKKGGGAYLTSAGRLRKINDFSRVLRLVDGTAIPPDNIVEIKIN